MTRSRTSMRCAARSPPPGGAALLINQPAINIDGGTNGAFTAAARAAGLVGANETFLDADRGGVTVLSGRTGKALKRYSTAVTTRPGPPGGMVGGADVASLGDLDGDGLEELVVWEPVPQRLQLLDGADLHVLWKVDVTSLERPE